MVIKMKGNNMSKCLDCRWFDPQCNECNQDNHCPCVYRDDEACDKFEQRKKCEHRYENCDINGCSIICHKFPSECGCDFYYQCKLDNYYCDENCEKHKNRKELEDLKEEMFNLYDAMSAIDKVITRFKNKIKELEEKLNKV